MELLTVDKIRECGGYTGGPVQKEIKWSKGGDDFEAFVYIRPMSYHTAVQDILPGESRQMRVARRLAACICDDEGVPLFTMSDITGLDDQGKPIKIKDPESGKMVERGPLSVELSTALMEALAEVTGLGKRSSKEKSQSKTQSGTNSSSVESVDEPSKKLNES